MSSNTKCFYVYQPQTKDFLKIDFAFWPHQNDTYYSYLPSKHERKLTHEDDLELVESLGTMEFQTITIKPAQ